MKVHAYRVVTDNNDKLDSVLAFIKSQTHADRIRQTATTRLRFEDGSRARNGNWTLDFTKFRSAGPGKAPESAPNLDFDLAADEHFGEETAGLYSPGTDVIVLQYNHYGPRVAAIESYLAIFAGEARDNGASNVREIALEPIARRDAAQRLREATVIKRLEFSLHVPGALQTPPRRRQALGTFLMGPVIPSAQHVSVQVSAGHSRSLNVSAVKAFVNQALGLDEGLSQLRVKKEADNTEPSGVIDMLEARLQLDRPLVHTSKRRYDRNARWSALRSAYDEWERNQCF